MADHFACIGLSFADAGAFQSGVASLMAEAVPEEGPLGTRLLWTDPSGSGAGLAAFMSGRAVACAKPTFLAPVSAVSVRTGDPVADAQGCAYCAMAGVEVVESAGGELAYPLAVELDDVHLGVTAPGSAGSLSVVAFAEDITAWPDRAAYEATGSMFGPQSLIPSGLFTPSGVPDRPVRAEAIMTGVVSEAAVRMNGFTGLPFQWAVVETFGGSYDVLAPASDAGSPDGWSPGTVVQGTFWLVASAGSLARMPVAERRGLFRRRRAGTK
jgi:hypothetical protein